VINPLSTTSKHSRRLANRKRLGGTVAKSSPGKISGALKEARIASRREGSIRSGDFASFGRLDRRGGWWNPYPLEVEKKFNTPSRKFEFFSLEMEQG
jgi:hypothetical protein